jgi:CDP-paratose 2-epimerase
MKILITGICGFVGRTLAEGLIEAAGGPVEIVGLDNLSRSGSWLNREPLRKLGVRVMHGDIRLASDVEAVGPVDWVIDAAANPSVLAGVDGRASSRQLVGHNLDGTVNLLEHCKVFGAGFTLLSTSRVYAIERLAALEVDVVGAAYCPRTDQAFPAGLSPAGIGESFSTTAPVSLYGATKLASEALALEYGEAFDFPVWINRCGVLAGAGQFGRADQGIFSFWIHSWKAGLPLKYIGFDGLGHQVRDCLHPRDLVLVLLEQIRNEDRALPRIFNFGGGAANKMSLSEISAWCGERFGPATVGSDPSARRYDLPWVVMDCGRAGEVWDWKPRTSLESVLEEIACHAEKNPGWLSIVGD